MPLAPTLRVVVTARRAFDRETFGDSPHPDNTRNTKLNWIKRIPEHMNVPTHIVELWIWCVATFARA